MDIKELIARCKKNDRKAQFELYQMEFNNLMRYAIRYKTNEEDAAEIVNQAFFKVLTNLDKYNPSYSFSAWCMQILKNLIIDDFRKNQKNKAELINIDDNEHETFDASALNDVEIALEENEAEKILSYLDEVERTVFNLYEIDGYSHKEIAESLAISERTSKRYLAKARKSLKKIINQLLNTTRIAV